MQGSFSTLDISASGMAAERQRMEVTANNIANANTTQTESGEPFRRRSVVFSALMDQTQADGGTGLAGVRVAGIELDQSDFKYSYQPGHPHADEAGMVATPNIQLPNEMVDMISASRSYEANLNSITLFKEMIEQSLTLLNGGR